MLRALNFQVIEAVLTPGSWLGCLRRPVLPWPVLALPQLQDAVWLVQVLAGKGWFVRYNTLKVLKENGPVAYRLIGSLLAALLLAALPDPVRRTHLHRSRALPQAAAGVRARGRPLVLDCGEAEDEWDGGPGLFEVRSLVPQPLHLCHVHARQLCRKETPGRRWESNQGVARSPQT